MSPKVQRFEKFEAARATQRYEAAMRSRGLPAEQCSKAVAKFKRAMDDEARARLVLERLSKTQAVPRVGERRLLDSLARGIAGDLRRERPEELAGAIARRVARRVTSGMSEEKLLAVVEAVLRELGRRGLAQSVREQVTSLREDRVSRKAESPSLLERDRVMLSEFLSDLNEPDELERFRVKEAASLLKTALRRVRPWARKVVVGRLSGRKSDATLARLIGVRTEDVKAILEQARKLVSEYTRYFDDDWYWHAPVKGGL